MRTRAALLLVALAASAHALPAEARHRKPLSGSYAVTIPVPFPVEGATAHCTEGVDALTRSATKVTIPETGQLDVKVTGFTGDWVLEVFDAKGRVLATGASLDPTSGVRTAKWKKKKAGSETVTLTVCNYGGTPTGQVDWTFAFSR